MTTTKNLSAGGDTSLSFNQENMGHIFKHKNYYAIHQEQIQDHNTSPVLEGELRGGFQFLFPQRTHTHTHTHSGAFSKVLYLHLHCDSQDKH